MGKQRDFELDFKLGDGTTLKSQFSAFDGDDSFETYKSIPGNEEKTLDDFYEYLKGISGNGVVSVTLTKDEDGGTDPVDPVDPTDPEETKPVIFKIKNGRHLDSVADKGVDLELELELVDKTLTAEQLEEATFANIQYSGINVAVREQDGKYMGTITNMNLPNATLDGKEQTVGIYPMAIIDGEPRPLLRILIDVKPEFKATLGLPAELKDGFASAVTIPSVTRISDSKEYQTNFTSYTALDSLDYDVTAVVDEATGAVRMVPVYTSEKYREEGAKTVVQIGTELINDNESIEVLVAPFDMSFVEYQHPVYTITPVEEEPVKITATGYPNRYIVNTKVTDADGKPVADLVAKQSTSQFKLDGTFSQADKYDVATNETGEISFVVTVLPEIGKTFVVTRNLGYVFGNSQKPVTMYDRNDIAIEKISSSVDESGSYDKDITTTDVTVTFKLNPEGKSEFDTATKFSSSGVAQTIEAGKEYVFEGCRFMEARPYVPANFVSVRNTETNTTYNVDGIMNPIF